MATAKGMIVLMGSGELTATMVEVHKDVLARFGDSPRAVFVDTPAGFQLNVDQISRKAAEYFRVHVQHTLTVASLKSAEPTEAYERDQAFRSLREADYILVGPGSPTYAVRQWAQTPFPDVLTARIEDGACLVAASAAALTVGRFTLPVYEIYKVGEELHWVDGMDILGRFGFPVAVVPHWNNAEGGTHDTRFCYMGEPRFQRLESVLPEAVGVLGIDEHTACILDLRDDVGIVKGIGCVTFRNRGGERAFERGDRFSLDLLRGESCEDGRTRDGRMPNPVATSAAQLEDPFWDRVHACEASFHKGLEAHDLKKTTNALLDLDRLLWHAQRDLQDEESISQGREILRDMIVLLGTRLGSVPRSAEDCVAPLVEELVALRARFREQKKWAEADAIRECLEREKILIEDARDGSRWRFAR